MNIEKLFAECIGFQWDLNKRFKNFHKHDVTWQECEQIFFNVPFIVSYDKKHSQGEKRYYALGCTDNKRKLMLVFTVRRKLIRVISARDMSKKERVIYHEKDT